MADKDQHDGSDAATQAFEEVRAELTLLRRAIERLTAGRAEVPEPVDYSETLGRISNNLTATAQRIDALAKGAAQSMTPAHVADRIVAAGSEARRNDQQIIAEARSGLDQATRQLAGVVASARRGDEQNRWLAGAGVGGLIVGMALWAALAGPFARAMPNSWQWPERMAARALDRPMWDAGQQLMVTVDPASFGAIVASEQIVRANRNTIEGCRKTAAKARESVRCTIRVGASL